MMAKTVVPENWDIVATEWWLNNYGDEFIYINRLNEYYQYCEGVYLPIGLPVIRQRAKFYLRSREYPRSAPKVKLLLEMVQEHHGFQLEDFDKDKNIVNLKNGFYYLDSQTLIEHSMEYKSFVQYDFEFTITPEETPYLDEFRSHYPDQLFAIERYLQSMLYRDFSHEQMLNLLGPPRAGKGTILNIINKAFGKQVINGSLHDLGGDFGLGLLINALAFMDKEMAIKGFDADTIKVCKSVTGLDWVQGVSINIKGVKKFIHPIIFFIVTAANQFGVLPYGVDEDAWFCRTNIQIFDQSFPSNPAMKEGILLEVDDWISELILIPYHNWTLNMDKVNDWAPHQRDLWQSSSRTYQNIAAKYFEKADKYTLKAERVVNFFRHILKEERKGVPPEQKLMGYITSEFAGMGITKSRLGRHRVPLYHNVRPKNKPKFDGIVGEDTLEHEIEMNLLDVPNQDGLPADFV